MNFTLICPCHFGLESVLAGEIRRMGGENVVVNDGKVAFEGGKEMIARANLCLRTAERVLIKLGNFLRVLLTSSLKELKRSILKALSALLMPFLLKDTPLILS